MNRHDEKVIASARKQRALFDELEKALAEELNALDGPSKSPSAQSSASMDAAERDKQREAEFMARLDALIAEHGLDRKSASAWLLDLNAYHSRQQ